MTDLKEVAPSKFRCFKVPCADGGLFSLKYDDQDRPLLIKMPELKIARGISGSGKSYYLELSLGTSGAKPHLEAIDEYMADWVAKYNAKFGTSWSYVTMVTYPLMKNEAGELVVNQKSLDEYGKRLTCKIKSLNSSRCAITIETENKSGTRKLQNPDILDAEPLFVQGAAIASLLEFSGFGVHENKVYLRPRLIKAKVRSHEADSIDLELASESPNVDEIIL